MSPKNKLKKRGKDLNGCVRLYVNLRVKDIDMVFFDSNKGTFYSYFSFIFSLPRLDKTSQNQLMINMTDWTSFKICENVDDRFPFFLLIPIDDIERERKPGWNKRKVIKILDPKTNFKTAKRKKKKGHLL